MKLTQHMLSKVLSAPRKKCNRFTSLKYEDIFTDFEAQKESFACAVFYTLLGFKLVSVYKTHIIILPDDTDQILS